MRGSVALGSVVGVALLSVALAGGGCGLDSEGNFGVDTGGGSQTATSTGPGGAGGGLTVNSGGNTSTSSTSGTAGSGGTTSGSGGAGGCVPTTEDCLNSLDDDCDGDVDCEDSDCGNFGCKPLPTGATFATVEQQQCAMGLTQINADSCDDCGCSVGFAGTCTHVAVLYDNKLCAGSASERTLVQVLGCTSAGTTAVMNDTVGAIADPVGRDDAVCAPDDVNGNVRDTSFCQLPSAGSCANAGEACVPTGRGLDCVMLSGNVDCAAPYTDKRLYFADTNATTCTCGCAGGPQVCPTDEHYHAHFNGACSGAKFDVIGDGACKDTGLTTVNSLVGHPTFFNADDARCDNQSEPSGAPAATTVCCTP
jgi:hypothetical protein